MCLKCLKEGGEGQDGDTVEVDEQEFCSLSSVAEEPKKTKKTKGRHAGVAASSACKQKKAYRVHAYPLFYEQHVQFRRLSSSASSSSPRFYLQTTSAESAATAIVVLPSFNQSILEYMSIINHFSECGAAVYGVEQRLFGINYTDAAVAASSDMTLSSYISDYLEVLETIRPGKYIKVFACGTGCLVALSATSVRSVSAIYLYDPISYVSSVSTTLLSGGQLKLQINVTMSQAILLRRICHAFSNAPADSDCSIILECDRRFNLRGSISQRNLLSRQLYNDYPDSFTLRAVSNSYFDEIASHLQLISRSIIEVGLAIAVDSSSDASCTALMPAALVDSCVVIHHEPSHCIPADLYTCYKISNFFSLSV